MKFSHLFRMQLCQYKPVLLSHEIVYQYGTARIDLNLVLVQRAERFDGIKVSLAYLRDVIVSFLIQVFFQSMYSFLEFWTSSGLS
mmetsp:Transcript_14209/g.32724  ORF Transcript_14209/g.32724 Transcript_14209/m.32724 type:complete len:85 (-) Transcript_14209:14-268(-)